MLERNYQLVMKKRKRGDRASSYFEERTKALEFEDKKIVFSSVLESGLSEKETLLLESRGLSNSVVVTEEHRGSSDNNRSMTTTNEPRKSNGINEGALQTNYSIGEIF